MLLDTNIVSYLVKEDSRIEPYIQDLESDREHAISLITTAELWLWITIRKWSTKRVQQLKY